MKHRTKTFDFQLLTSARALRRRMSHASRFIFHERGFTLVELIVVIAIIGMLSFLTLPFVYGLYQSFEIDATTQEIIQTLRRSQSKSLSVEDDTAFGIKILSNQFILFKGASYAARAVSYDETFSIPSSVVPSGIDEIVFAKLDGKTANIGNIILTSSAAGKTKTISINAWGRVNLE